MGVEGGVQVREESRKPSARVVGGMCVHVRARMYAYVRVCAQGGGSSVFGQCPHYRRVMEGRFAETGPSWIMRRLEYWDKDWGGSEQGRDPQAYLCFGKFPLAILWRMMGEGRVVGGLGSCLL